MSDTIPPPPKAQSPGTARISASLVQREEVTEGYRCLLEVDSVHGYGSGTPPLAPGTEIEVMFFSEMLDNVEFSSSADTLLAPGAFLHLTLKHAGMASLLGAQNSSWRVMSIHQNGN